VTRVKEKGGVHAGCRGEKRRGEMQWKRRGDGVERKGKGWRTMNLLWGFLGTRVGPRKRGNRGRKRRENCPKGPTLYIVVTKGDFLREIGLY